MSVQNARAALIRIELKLYLREKVGPVWGVAFPLVLLVILGNIPAFHERREANGGRTDLDLYVPVLIGFTLAILALTALPSALVAYRETGVLRRLKTTPVSPGRVLGAQLVANFSTALVSMVLFLAVAALAFGVDLPHDLGGFAVGWLLTAAALLSIGLLICALAPSRGVATAVGTALFFPMMFFAGLWLPIPQMPSLLRTIAEYSPLGAGVQALQDASHGQFPTAQALITLAAYAVVCAIAAARWFRWE